MLRVQLHQWRHRLRRLPLLNVSIRPASVIRAASVIRHTISRKNTCFRTPDQTHHSIPFLSHYSCCPCFALCTAANEAKLKNGCLYCVMTVCGFGCCALWFLGQDVEEKRGLKEHDGCWHCMNSWCDLCTCHSCRVVNECKVYAKDGAVNAAPTGTEMTRD